MAVSALYLAYVLEQLEPLGAVSSRRMFGGIGLYCGELFFGLVDDDTLYFKANDSNAGDYLARRMPRFMPDPARPESTMGYFQVPAEIVEDGEELGRWARKSVAVALSARAAKTSRPPARKSAKKKSPQR